MIRDLIYFDFDRASSLISQIEGGLRTQLVEGKKFSAEGQATAEGTILSFAKFAGKGDLAGSLERVQTKAMHHETLAAIEHYLAQNSFLQVLSDQRFLQETAHDKLREEADRSPYVKASGFCSIEDYSSIGNLFGNFKELALFINRCHDETIKGSAEYQQVQAALQEAKKIAGQSPKKDRADQHAKIRGIESQLSMSASLVEQPADWLVAGLLHWIKTFAPNRICLRLLPFKGNKRFQVVCDLKPSCFVDGDAQRILYSYGAFPSVRLGVIGLMTSLPPKDSPPVRPEDFAQPGAKENEFLSAFQNLFVATSSFERFLGLGRYPNVFVQPLAIYRDFEAT